MKAMLRKRPTVAFCLTSIVDCHIMETGSADKIRSTRRLVTCEKYIKNFQSFVAEHFLKSRPES
jgi:hypothetical protein